MEARDLQPDAREGQVGPGGVAERLVVPLKPGNAGGGKGSWFKADVEKSESRKIGVSLSTPLSDSAVTDRTLLASEDCDVFRSHDQSRTERRVLAGEASRRAGCGKSARPVR